MLELRHIYKQIDNQIILNNISIQFPDRGFIGIEGKSGSGKSTLLSIIGMLDDDYEGKILYNHCSIDDKQKFIRNHISYMMQNKDDIQALTVKENILLPLFISQKSYKKSDLKKVVHRLQLENHLNKYPQELSGGERKRVSIAKAIMKKANIILCDEPTSALHISQSREVMDLLKELSSQCLIIVVSHDHKLLREYCDDILTLNDGRLSGEVNQTSFQNELISKHKYSLLFYPIRQLIYQKNKLLFLIIFEVFSILSFLLLSGVYFGLTDSLEKITSKGVLSHVLVIENKNHAKINFESIHKIKVDDNYMLEMLDSYYNNKKVNSNKYILPRSTTHIQLLKGQFPKKEDEVLISYELYKSIKEDIIVIEFENFKQELKVTGIVEPLLLDEKEIYFHYLFLNKVPFLKDDYSCRIEVNDNTKEIYRNLSSEYLVENHLIEKEENYQTLFDYMMIIAAILLIAILIISLTMIFIVEGVLLEERKKDNVYLLSLGLKNKYLSYFLLQENMILNIFIQILSIILFYILTHYFNHIYNLQLHYYFSLTLKKVFYSKYDIFIFMSILFSLLFILGGIISSKKLKSLRLIELLRET